MVRLYSTLHREIVDLETRTPSQVGIYYCGATVQGEPHMGHAFSGVAFDTIARYLEWRGHDVTLVRNVTDIDDKIIEKANDAGVPIAEHAQAMERLFTEMYAALGVRQPEAEPHATEHIAEMQEMIASLIETGHAYESQGDVYFAVRKDDDYGRLSGRDLDDMRAGARVEVSGLKKDPLDFAMWKASKAGEPSWDSPWGPGRPGWHIECSAMALKYLGEGFEIHGGGSDLIFPHHENEIAQAETASGATFARYWLHNGMVTLGGMKMSKSIGNVIGVDEALARYGGRILRLLFLRAHYRSNLEFNWEVLEEVATSMERLDRFFLDHPETGGDPDEGVLERFSKAMDDDFGTPGGVSVIFDTIRDANRAEADGEDIFGLVAAVRELVSVLGLDDAAEVGSGDLLGAVNALAEEMGVAGSESLETTVDALLERRAAARSSKDFDTSDAIRDRLGEAGIVVDDTADGQRWLRG